MFTAAKAHKLSKRAREHTLNMWERLQFEIRKKAMEGETSLFIENEEYLLLTTTLNVFGYEVEFDPIVEKWRISW